MQRLTEQCAAVISSSDPESLLHLLERHPFGFRIASIVKTKFVAPMVTACKSDDTLLKPAKAKISFK